MYLSKSFVAVMGVVTLLLIVSFAAEESECVARARRIFRDMMRSNPVSLEFDVDCAAPTVASTPR